MLLIPRKSIIIFRVRLLMLAFLSIISLGTMNAQKMSIESFDILEKDNTANLQPTMVKDQNDEKCALIKIQTTQHNFMFDVGTLGIVRVDQQNSEHPGEIWLYVPHGVKKISIQHPEFGSINDYDLGRSLKKGKTYLLKLTSDQVNTLVVDYDNSQYLRVEVTPPDATFMINGIRQQLNEKGVTEIPLPFGTHTYRITHKDYHPSEDKIVINDKDNRQELKVSLSPAFGYISIDGGKDIEMADIFIDGEKVATLPASNIPVHSGQHELKVYKKLFNPHIEGFTMTDGNYLSFHPILSDNYGIVTLKTNDKEAGIYDNGQFLANGQWSGKMEAGLHSVETRKVSHSPVARQITVVSGKKDEIMLDNPVPIYGSLEIATDPQGAEVVLDGKIIGKTPLVSNTILVGSHDISLNLPGHKTENLRAEISKDEVSRHNVKLTDFCTATISSSPSYATLRIDGKYQPGGMPHKFDLIAGKYNIEVSARGYTTYNKTLELNGTTKDISVTLRRNYIRKNEFYLQAGYNILAMPGLNFGMGAYISNVNIEANYLLGLSKSPEIYWNDSEGSMLPRTATYTPQGWNAKAGYGIRLFNRMRLTPQVGIQMVALKEKISEFSLEDSLEEIPDAEKIANGASALSLSFGVRINFALLPCLGISITPEYLIPVSKSDAFKTLSDLSPKIKGYSEGFGCNLSVNLFF